MAVSAVTNLMSSIVSFNSSRALQAGDKLAMKTQSKSGNALSDIANTTSQSKSGTTGAFTVSISGIGRAKSGLTGQ